MDRPKTKASQNVHPASPNLASDATAFLDAHLAPGWQVMHVFTADCSPRTYARIRLAKPLLAESPPLPPRALDTVLLMDTGRLEAPGETTENAAFLSNFLRACGLYAPRTVAVLPEKGFLLQEDFGDILMKAFLEKSETPFWQHGLWGQALDTLQDLIIESHAFFAKPKTQAQHPFVQSLPPLDSTVLGAEVDAFLDFGLPFVGINLSDADKAQARALWKNELHAAQKPDHLCVLSLRDVHTENLMLVPAEADAENARPFHIGLIDYQDALWGHPAYDLVSLLQDARVPFDAAASENYKTMFMERLFKNWAGAPLNADAFQNAYYLLGLQRAIKIFGVFCRLAMRDNMPQKLPYLRGILPIIEHNMDVLGDNALTRWVRGLNLARHLDAKGV